MNKVAIITSGGDGSGVNLAINILANSKEYNLYGFDDGYDGIVRNKPILFDKGVLENKNLEGKQFIRTSRSSLPFTVEGRKKIIERLESYDIKTLIICGGNGSQIAAKKLYQDGLNTMFIPMTVDNDVCGTEYTLGHDSAINRVKDIVHDLNDTANNMPGRIFMVEVLGGNCGNIALNSALATDSDLAIIPELSRNLDDIVLHIKNKLKEKKSITIICSEAAYPNKSYKVGAQGVSFEIGKYIEEKIGIRVRHTIMGFYMRSGIPSATDCLNAVKLGYIVKQNIERSNYGIMASILNGVAVGVKYNEIIEFEMMLDKDLLEIARNKNIVI